MARTPTRLLIAASGTGGHLFPALAVAKRLPDYEIEWLGVPDRLEQSLVPKTYPLHTIPIEGFQTRFGLKTLKILFGQLRAIWQVRSLIKKRQIAAVFTTGGYIAGPTILAARLANIPVILHESNYIPGKVTKVLGRWCDKVALGFQGTASYLPGTRSTWVSTPVREQFLIPQSLDLPIPEDAFLIVVAGGSQGAVALNQIVRQSAPQWLEKGIYIVHLTGENDPEADSLRHSNYFSRPFYDNMAGLWQRANLAISRSGAGTLTELAITCTPSILIPYPFAAEDHQFYNAQVFAEAQAAYLYRQNELTAQFLSELVLDLWSNPEKLAAMAQQASHLAISDSADLLADLLRRKSQKDSF
jgi:UDP-N-acetylglucosamine--N-acetylmuramyl-(pentapeptide) pyrophosphoryl-undecaprenol N-acetylglucosamine transferase